MLARRSHNGAVLVMTAAMAMAAGVLLLYSSRGPASVQAFERAGESIGIYGTDGLKMF